MDKGIIEIEKRYKENSPGQTSNLYRIITPQVGNYAPGGKNGTGEVGKLAGGMAETLPPSSLEISTPGVGKPGNEVLINEGIDQSNIDPEELTKEEKERQRLFFDKGLVYKCLIDCIYPALEKYTNYYLGFYDFSDHLQEEIEAADPTTKSLLKKIWAAAEKLIEAMEAINRPRPRFIDFDVVRDTRKPGARDESEYQIKAYADYCRISKTFVTTDPEKLPEKLIQCDWVMKLHQYLKPLIEDWKYDPVYDEELLQSHWVIELYYWELIYDGYKCKRQENRIVYAGEEYRRVNSQSYDRGRFSGGKFQ